MLPRLIAFVVTLTLGLIAALPFRFQTRAGVREFRLQSSRDWTFEHRGRSLPLGCYSNDGIEFSSARHGDTVFCDHYPDVFEATRIRERHRRLFGDDLSLRVVFPDDLRQSATRIVTTTNR